MVAITANGPGALADWLPLSPPLLGLYCLSLARLQWEAWFPDGGGTHTFCFGVDLSEDEGLSTLLDFTSPEVVVP